MSRHDETQEGGGALLRAAHGMMEKREIEELRDKVSCAALLEKAGWKFDHKESTRRAIKYRRDAGQIVIVIHGGRGWFDPLSDAKGDVFGLAEHLGADGFISAAAHVADHVGFVFTHPEWTCHARVREPASLDKRWNFRSRLAPGSPCWRYLSETRALPAAVLRYAVECDLLREGPQGSMWARHIDDANVVVGWEERGPKWRGFATGGTKTLFRVGPPGAKRLAVTEAAIDAMSLAAIEGLRRDTLYVSTGGGWSPATEAALVALARSPDVELVAATDNNTQGESFARRLREIAETAGCAWRRSTPEKEDWNEQLRAKANEAEWEEWKAVAPPLPFRLADLREDVPMEANSARER